MKCNRSLRVVAVTLLVVLVSCREKPTVPAEARIEDPQAWFEITTKEFHIPSAATQSPERERLQDEAARRYAALIQQFPGESNLCAQALRSIGNIRAAQTNISEAVRQYSTVADRYGSQRWEMLQALKSAGDLLWEANLQAEAKGFYRQITNRFGSTNEPVIIQTVVRGSKARLIE